jgi:hypothetical protein
VRIVREGVHERVFRDVPPDEAAALTFAVLGMYRAQVIAGAVTPEDASASALDFILHGLAAPA